MKPNLFLGSSSEASALLDGLAEELSSVAVVQPWYSKGLFVPGAYTLPALQQRVSTSDFAVLLLSADDLVASRDSIFDAPRDNVVLELGMFLNGLGLERTFIVVCDDVKLPSDLFGLTVIKYRGTTSNIEHDAIQSVVLNIRNRVRALGMRTDRVTKTEALTFKEWFPVEGKWLLDDKSLELGGDSELVTPAYIWSPQRLRVGAVIEFDLSMIQRDDGLSIFDFRIALFSSSKAKGIDGPGHHLIIAPWSGYPPVLGGCDIRVDYVAAKYVDHKIQIPEKPRFMHGRPYAFRVEINASYVNVSIDTVCRVLYPIDVTNELQQGRNFFGFSSHTAHIFVNNLKTNLG